jgi:2-oxoglutarate dehydrogenase E2 component (dihydrolipoamide succinyltransferase)
MPIDIKVPPVGESVTEATVGRWLKADGAAVAADEVVLELETDKATQEVVAPAKGVLKIAKKEGERVAIGAVVGHVDPQAQPTAKAKEPARPATERAPARKDEATSAAPAKSTPTTAEPVLSPAARQVAADENVSVGRIAGTGRGGRIIKEDVLAALSEAEPSSDEADGAPPPPRGKETRQRMSPIRQRIAERLLYAQQSAAILTTFNEADMSAVIALRTRHGEAFQKKHGVRLGFMSFFVKAAIDALRAFPRANAFLDGSDIVYHHYHHIGVAVSTDKGLMVPVLRDADRMSFADIEKAIAELSAKARDNKISVGDLQGGTFTITNGGVFGSLLSTPILNPPQSGILGMHTIQKRPVAVDDQVVIRPMMYLAFSYDHRLIDGREAVSFLVRVKECIEAPDRMLLEV